MSQIDDVDLKEFFEDNKASKIIFLSLKEIIPNKNNWFAFIISFLISLITAILIVLENNSIEHLKNIVSKVLDVELSIFSCVLAVYAIMLAFLNEDYMRILLKGRMGNSSVLKTYMSYYDSVLFLYFIGLCITGIYMLGISFLPKDFVLTTNNEVNSVVGFIVVFLYMLYSVRILYELKSTIFNTIMLFRASVVEKLKKKN